MSSFADNCSAVPVVVGWWLFEYPKRHRARLQLCAEHPAALEGDPRLTLG